MVKQKEVISFAEDIFFAGSPERRLNGGYVFIDTSDVFKVKRENKWIYNIRGWLVSGTDDCGDGHAEKFTDDLNCCVEVDKNGEMELLVNDALDKAIEFVEENCEEM